MALTSYFLHHTLRGHLMLMRALHLLATITLTGALATPLLLGAPAATAQAAPPEGTDTCVTWGGDVVDDSSPNCMSVLYAEDTLPCGPGDGCTNNGRPWVCRLLEAGPTERYLCKGE